MRIDAVQCGLAAGQRQTVHHVRCFHETEIQQHAGDAGADRHQLDALLRRYPRLIGCDDGDQQHTLVQNPIMTQMVRQRERDTRSSRR